MRTFVIALLLICGIARAAVADVTAYRFTWENDTFQAFDRTDRSYTNGMRFSITTYGTDDSTRTTWWAQRIAGTLMPWVDGAKASGWAIGQNMYTPTDIASRIPDPGDRPYGGFLYFATTAEVSGHTAKEGRRLRFRDTHRFEVDIGVIGPPSLAEGSQKLAHELIGAQRPNGWDHQISTKLAASVLYDWQLELLRITPKRFSADILTNVGLTLGSVINDTHIGVTSRIGINTYDELWPERIKPVYHNATLETMRDSGRKATDVLEWAHDVIVGAWNCVRRLRQHELYLFGSANGKIALGNVFIDEGLPFIKREYFVGDISYGIVLGLCKRVEFTYQQVFRTKEFRTQEHSNSYGSLNVVVLNY